MDLLGSPSALPAQASNHLVWILYSDTPALPGALDAVNSRYKHSFVSAKRRQVSASSTSAKVRVDVMPSVIGRADDAAVRSLAGSLRFYRVVPGKEKRCILLKLAT